MEKHSLLRALFLALIITTAIALSSCVPTRTLVAPERHHDTLIAHHYTLDSVFVHESERLLPGAKFTHWCQTPLCKSVPDTVVITRVKERWCIKRDTVHIAHRDSVPFPVEVIREVPSPIPRAYRYSMWFTISAIVILICYGIIRLRYAS